MYLVPDALILEWSESKETPLPVSARLRCPHCRQLIGFSIRWPEELNKTVNTAVSTCLFCRKQVIFVQVAPSLEDDELYVYPPPQIRSPLPEINASDTYSNKLTLDYTSALKAYNLGEWAPAIASCRRVLEEMMQTLERDDETIPVDTNESLPTAMNGYKELSQRWKSIVRRVQKLLNNDLAAVEINKQEATRMVDLVDYFLQCFFILPAKTDALLLDPDAPS
jgi:hypothetical protein